MPDATDPALTAPDLLVLAAGMGSRYGGLKQIDPVGPAGEVVLDYSVYDALRAGFGRVVFLIRKEIEADFMEAVGRHFEGRLPVAYAYQELTTGIPAGFTPPAGRKKPWGTAHAVLCARAVLNRPFAVINADDFYGAESYARLASFLRTPPPPGPVASYAMVGFRLRQTLSRNGSVARGLCDVGHDGELRSVTEHTAITPDGRGRAFSTAPDGQMKPLSGDEIASMNLWGFQPSIFGHLQSGFERFLQERGQDPKAEFYLPEAVSELVEQARARVKVLTTSGAWFGVTYREDKPRVQQGIRSLIATGVYPKQLWAQATGQD